MTAAACVSSPLGRRAVRCLLLQSFLVEGGLAGLCAARRALTGHRAGLAFAMAQRSDSARRLPRDAAVSDRGSSRKSGDPKQINGRKARAVLDRPSAQGWKTSDEDEIALRRWRGASEIISVEPLEGEHPLFGTFRVQSGSGGFYEVEIRSMHDLVNSCGCIDQRVNGLGTCKHIEFTLAQLERKRGAGKAFARGYQPAFSELYLRNARQFVDSFARPELQLSAERKSGLGRNRVIELVKERAGRSGVVDQVDAMPGVDPRSARGERGDVLGRADGEVFDVLVVARAGLDRVAGDRDARISPSDHAGGGLRPVEPAR